MRTSVLISVLALFLSACSTAKPAKMNESTWLSSANTSNSSKVYKYELENGLKLIVLEDHSAPTFAYHTWFSVGSMDEDPKYTGLAHLFEHMMFKATKNHPDGDFDHILESAGAEGENAFTNRDYTGYVQSLPRHGKRDNLELIAELESDRMVNLIVDEEVLNKEREVVQNERRFRNENSPEGKMYERVYELAFKKHSYHWPVIGYEEHLQRTKAKECYEFYKRYYAPNNATIVIVGDVKHTDALNIVSKYYGAIPSSKIARRNIEKLWFSAWQE